MKKIEIDSNLKEGWLYSFTDIIGGSQNKGKDEYILDNIVVIFDFNSQNFILN